MLTALFANDQGDIYDAPGYSPLGRYGNTLKKLELKDMIPLPEGSELMMLPQRAALMDQKGKVEKLASSLYAVAAILPVGYTRTYVPAFEKNSEAEVLPLYGYTAVAMYKEEFYVAAVKTSDNEKWHPYKYNTSDLTQKIASVKETLKENRLVEHLAKCTLEWNCCTAQNLFHRRWEAGVPVSKNCNANCLGCISLQPAECCPSAQSRITFRPTPKEITDIGVFHLANAPEAIISFGQGCEGEPSLEADTISESIKLIRQETKKGLININTNAGYTEGIKKISDAGLNSMRVSMNSANEKTYNAYYRANYTLAEVKESIIYAKAKGVYVSINMLMFPGVNDEEQEAQYWLEFIKETGVDMIQLRNLNIDPDWYMSVIGEKNSKVLGVEKFIATLHREVPTLEIGNFTVYKQK